MPASVLHYTFINELFKNNKYQDVLNVAGQGPDPFFFYGYGLGSRPHKKEVQQFGTFLHHIDPAIIYEYLIKYALKKPNNDMLFAFIEGFMDHYCLDRNAHPYIFYISGFSDNPEEKKKYSLKHAEVETALDALVIEKRKMSGNIAKLLKINKEDLISISEMFYSLARDVFNNPNVDRLSYYYGVKDMRFVYRVLNSPLKIKKALFEVFLKNNIVNYLSLPRSTKNIKKYDLFNVKHQKWLNCVNGNIRFESFEDLWVNAKKDAQKVHEILESPNEKQLKDKLCAFSKNIDHDGFIVNSKKKYFELRIPDKK